MGSVGCRATWASSIAVHTRGMMEVRSRLASRDRVLELDRQLGTMRADTAPVALMFMSVGLGTWRGRRGGGGGEGPGHTWGHDTNKPLPSPHTRTHGSVQQDTGLTSSFTARWATATRRVMAMVWRSDTAGVSAEGVAAPCHSNVQAVVTRTSKNSGRPMTTSSFSPKESEASAFSKLPSKSPTIVRPGQQQAQGTKGPRD